MEFISTKYMKVIKLYNQKRRQETMNYNENDVVMAMKSQKDVFEKLYKSIYTDLFKMSFYIIGNREQAKDIVSETVLDAYTGIAKLKDSTKFEQWILRILTVKCKRS